MEQPKGKKVERKHQTGIHTSSCEDVKQSPAEFSGTFFHVDDTQDTLYREQRTEPLLDFDFLRWISKEKASLEQKQVNLKSPPPFQPKEPDKNQRTNSTLKSWALFALTPLPFFCWVVGEGT